jgi:hypothetical protein
VPDLLFVCTDPSAKPASARDNFEERASEYDSWGLGLLRHLLADVDKTVTVRVRRNRRLITDGPFIETKEWSGIRAVPDLGNRTTDEIILPAGREPYAGLPRRGATRPPARGRARASGPSGRIAAPPRGSARTPCPWLEGARGRG